MTYHEYCNELLIEMDVVIKSILQRSVLLSQPKTNSQNNDNSSYVDLYNLLSTLSDKCEKVLALIEEGKVNGNDEIELYPITTRTMNVV